MKPAAPLVRPSNDHQRVALKAATRRAILSAGRAKSFQHDTRVNEAQLSKYCGQDYPDYMPIDIALDADLTSGQPVIASALAEAQGYRLVPEALDGCGPVDLADLAGLIRETNDVVGGLADNLKDGKLDRAEARDLVQEIEEALSAYRTLQRKVQAVLFEGRAGL